MEDAELDFSGVGVEDQSSSMESLLSAGFLNECLRDTTTQHRQHACSHMHTCNPPGPDHSHTHTCLHVHTKIVPAPTTAADHTPPESAIQPSSKRPRKGNCEAVRKYRMKKKARTASLEEEVAQLREINQQLLKRLQGQAALEAEVARLRCLLVDIRGRIEGEIGAFPYQNPTRVGVETMANVPPMSNMGQGQFVNPCSFNCDEQLQCLYTGMQEAGGVESNGQGFGVCGRGAVQCMGDFGSGIDILDCGRGGVMPSACLSSANKLKGSQAAKEC